MINTNLSKRFSDELKTFVNSQNINVKNIFVLIGFDIDTAEKIDCDYLFGICSNQTIEYIK